MTQEDWLRSMSDAEFETTVRELEDRAEEFSAQVRILVNDELRRRGKPILGFGKARH